MYQALLTTLVEVISYAERIYLTYQRIQQAKEIKESIENIYDYATPKSVHDKAELNLKSNHIQKFAVLYALFFMKHLDKMNPRDGEITKHQYTNFGIDIVDSFGMPVYFPSTREFISKLAYTISQSYIYNIYPSCRSTVFNITKNYLNTKAYVPLSDIARQIRIIPMNDLGIDWSELAANMANLDPGTSERDKSNYRADAAIYGKVLFEDWNLLLDIITNLDTNPEVMNFYAPTRTNINKPGTERIPSFDNIALAIKRAISQLENTNRFGKVSHHLIASDPMLPQSIPYVKKGPTYLVVKWRPSTPKGDDTLTRDVVVLLKGLADAMQVKTPGLNTNESGPGSDINPGGNSSDTTQKITKAARVGAKVIRAARNKYLK